MRIKVEKAPFSKPLTFIKMPKSLNDLGDYIVFVFGYQISLFWSRK